jgi:uncharacterized membrane protein YidH (DUF202 family)
MKRETVQVPVKSGLELWIGFLGAPVVWLIQFQTNYTLVPWTCAHGHHYLLHLSSALFLALGIVLVFLTLKHWRQNQRLVTDSQSDSSPAGIAAFMSMVGLMNSGLFSLLILAQAIPPFFLSPCLE